MPFLTAGNSSLKLLNTTKSCANVDLADLENLLPWNGTPEEHCGRDVTCQVGEYFEAVEVSGKRQTIEAGDVLMLDHGLTITTLAANGTDIDGNTDDVFFDGRRSDCGVWVRI